MNESNNLPREYQAILAMISSIGLMGGVKIIKTTKKDGTFVYLLCLVTPRPDGNGFGLSPIAEMIDVKIDATTLYNNPESDVVDSAPKEKSETTKPLGTEEDLNTILKLLSKKPERKSFDMLFDSLTRCKNDFMKFGLKAKLEAIDTLIDFYGQNDEFEKCKTLLDIRHEISER